MLKIGVWMKSMWGSPSPNFLIGLIFFSKSTNVKGKKKGNLKAK